MCLLLMLTDATVTREVATEYYEVLQSRGRLLLDATGTTTLRVFATVDYWLDQGLVVFKPCLQGACYLAPTRVNL